MILVFRWVSCGMRLLLLFFSFADACDVCCTQVEEETNKTMYQRGSGSDFNSNKLFRETVSGQGSRISYTIGFLLVLGWLSPAVDHSTPTVSLYFSPTPASTVQNAPIF